MRPKYIYKFIVRLNSSIGFPLWKSVCVYGYRRLGYNLCIRERFDVGTLIFIRKIRIQLLWRVSNHVLHFHLWLKKQHLLDVTFRLSL